MTDDSLPAGLSAQNVAMSRAMEGDVVEIVSLINDEHERSNAVLDVSHDEVRSWVGFGLSFVAKHNNRIVGHSAMHVWPESGWLEIRGVVVDPNYRNHGIYSKMTRLHIEETFRAYPKGKIVVVKNESSKGARLLKSLGFVLVARGISIEVIEQGVPKEFFDIGPKDRQLRIWTLIKEDYMKSNSCLL